MKLTRRNFIKGTSIMFGAAVAGTIPTIATSKVQYQWQMVVDPKTFSPAVAVFKRDRDGKQMVELISDPDAVSYARKHCTFNEWV